MGEEHGGDGMAEPGRIPEPNKGKKLKAEARKERQIGCYPRGSYLTSGNISFGRDYT